MVDYRWLDRYITRELKDVVTYVSYWVPEDDCGYLELTPKSRRRDTPNATKLPILSPSFDELL